MDIYTTIVKIRGKAFLIAMTWNGGWTGWKIIFHKNCFPGLLMWKFVWDWSALLLDVVVFLLRLSGTTRTRISNEITENEWHLLMLLHRRLIVLGRNCPVRPVSRYGLDVARLAIIVGEHSVTDVALRQWFVRCGFTPARFDISFIMLSSVLCTKRCAAKLGFVVCGIELLALTISWSLKQSIWVWIEMAQVDFERFYWTSFRSWNGKYFRNLIHLQHRRGRPGVFFVAGKEPGWLLFSSKYSTPCGVFRRESIAGVNCRWFSRPRLPKKRPR